jgi:hypothetical protein
MERFEKVPLRRKELVFGTRQLGRAPEELAESFADCVGELLFDSQGALLLGDSGG